MNGIRQSVPKTYTFKDPVPVPDTYDIYSLSKESTEAADGDLLVAHDLDTKEGQRTKESSPLQQKEKPKEQQKRPTWLVRGDLSESTSVDDMLQLELVSLPTSATTTTCA